MTLITRQGKGSKLTTQEMDNNLLYLQSLGYSENPIVQAYLIAKEYTPYIANQRPDEIFGLFGMVVPYQEGMILPDTGFYTIASVEMHLKIAEAFGNSPYTQFVSRLFKIETITKSVSASIETYLKLNEAYNSYQYFDLTPNFNRQFVESFKNLKAFDYGNYEYFDRILDKGMVEWGSIGGKSQIDTLIGLTSLISYDGSDLEKMERMMDVGIVVLDMKKFPNLSWENSYPKEINGLRVMSVEQFLRYLENEVGPAVPA